MGMSYRRAWLLVDSLNRSFRDPVVAAQTGGAKGGGAALTPLGRAVNRALPGDREKRGTAAGREHVSALAAALADIAEPPETREPALE